MSNVEIRRRLGPVLVGLAIIAASGDTTAQVPNSYGIYSQQTATSLGGRYGPPSSSRYLYDKYFYHRPTVSPYMNVFRPDTDAGTSYQAFVRPELERREAASQSQSAYIQQRKLEGRVGETRYPSTAYGGGAGYNPRQPSAPQTKPTSSAYHNHWYGGWNNR